MSEMEVVALGRNRGKTEALLAWVAAAPENEHRVLVSHSLNESHRVQRIGMERGLESWQFVSVSEVHPDAWSGVLLGRGGRIVLGLDNIDIILPALLGREVGAVTVSVDRVGGEGLRHRDEADAMANGLLTLYRNASLSDREYVRDTARRIFADMDAALVNDETADTASPVEPEPSIVECGQKGAPHWHLFDHGSVPVRTFDTEAEARAALTRNSGEEPR